MTTRLTHATMRRTVGALLCTIVVPACAVARQQQPAPAAMDTTACAIVAAALDSLVIGRDDLRAGLFEETVPRSTVAGTGPREELAQVTGIDSSTMRSFREHNMRAEPACTTLPLVGGMTTVTQRALDSLPQRNPDGYWDAFHARYPGVMGVVRLSGVGVGAGGRQALLMVDHACGSLCGAGHVVLMERDDEGKWRVKRAVMTWIS